MLVAYGEDGEAIDYELHIAKADGGLKGVLVSPRSGEHKFKSVAWKDGALYLTIVRDFDGNEVEVRYEARLSEKGLSGKITLEGLEDFNGTWTATKK